MVMILHLLQWLVPFLAMMPHYGIISWKQGMKSVSWNLIVFVAAATALGKVLVDTGVVDWIEKEMLSVLHLFIDAQNGSLF